MIRNYSGESRLRLVTVLQPETVAEDAAVISGPDAAASVARKMIGGKDREHFMVIHLDARCRMISAEIVSVGTLTASLVHPREVFKGAILANACAIICAHNHPSGDVSPSAEDRATERRLQRAARLMGIELMDFLVVSDASSWASSEQVA